MLQRGGTIKIWKTKEWLDHLYYTHGRQLTNFRVIRTFNIKGETCFKWNNYLELQGSSGIHEVNQRTQLDNEIIFEHDGDDVSGFLKLMAVLKAQGICFYAYTTIEYRARAIHTYWDNELISMGKRAREQFRSTLLREHGCDMGFVTAHPIALEYTKHWKTGKYKMLINQEPGTNRVDMWKDKIALLKLKHQQEDMVRS